MKRAVNQPTSDLVLYAGIFCKTWHVADAGTLIPQHSHQHPHLTYLVRGAIRAWCDDQPLGDFIAPAAIKIPALRKHTFLTLSDAVTLACIHSVGEADDAAVADEHILELEG